MQNSGVTRLNVIYILCHVGVFNALRRSEENMSCLSFE